MNDNLFKNIVCSNCGTSNVPNTKFCIKCGTNLQAQSVVNATPSIIDNNVGSKLTDNIQSNNNINQNNANQPTLQPSNSNTNNNYSGISNNTITDDEVNLIFVEYIVGSLIKPFEKFKSNESKLNDLKNTSILALIIIISLTIIKLITTIITTVRVTSLWSSDVKWQWANIKNIPYFKVIGQSLLIYTGIIIAIAGIYFLANLVIKKDAKFVKLLGATSTSIIPFAVCSSIFAPLLSIIYASLGICITVIGFIYSLIILIELMNDLINIDNKNTRIYFHTICLSVLFIGGGFIAYKLILGSLTSGLGILGNILS